MADTKLRKIEPLKAPDIARPDPGDKPELVWLPLSALVVNDSYQRSLSDKSIRVIRKIVASFNWARIKALSVTDIGGGRYEVIDGQHTAIAAATHGEILELPCVVTAERSVQERAADFVGLNRDRLTMTPMQVFFALERPL